MNARMLYAMLAVALAFSLLAGPVRAQETKKDENPPAAKKADEPKKGEETKKADDKKDEEKKPDEAKKPDEPKQPGTEEPPKEVVIKINDLVIVTAETANLQRGKDIVAEVKKDQELKVLKIQQKWLGVGVDKDGKTVGGWLDRKHVKLKEKAETPAPAPTPEKGAPEKGNDGAVEAPDPPAKK